MPTTDFRTPTPGVPMMFNSSAVAIYLVGRLDHAEVARGRGFRVRGMTGRQAPCLVVGISINATPAAEHAEITL
jgi:hypothetical protein